MKHLVEKKIERDANNYIIAAFPNALEVPHAETHKAGARPWAEIALELASVLQHAVQMDNEDEYAASTYVVEASDALTKFKAFLGDVE